MAGKPPGIPSKWTLDKTALVSLSIVALLGAGIYVSRDFCWSKCKTIEALHIDVPTAGSAVGHYRMIDAGPVIGIEIDPEGSGGACLAWKSTANQRCKQHSDCNFPGNMTEIGPSPLYEGGYGLVLRPEFPGAFAYCSPQKTCWIRMKFSDCRKSPPAPDLKLNADNITNPANLYLVRKGLYGYGNGPRKIEGRVIACVSAKFTPTPDVKSPCGGGPGDTRHDWTNPPQPIPVPMGP